MIRFELDQRTTMQRAMKGIAKEEQAKFIAAAVPVVRKAVRVLKKHVQANLKGSRSGRTYTSGGRTYTASASHEHPAYRTGETYRSIRGSTRTKKAIGQVIGSVGPQKKRRHIVRFLVGGTVAGTRKLSGKRRKSARAAGIKGGRFLVAPRPFLKAAETAAAPQIRRILREMYQ